MRKLIASLLLAIALAVPIRAGSSFFFDGTDDGMTLATSYGSTAPFVIALWMCPQDVSVGRYLYTDRTTGTSSTSPASFSFHLAAGGELYFDVTSSVPAFASWLTSGVAMSAGTDCATANQWHFVAVYYRMDGTNGPTFYVDGVEVTSAISVGTCCPNGSNSTVDWGVGRRALSATSSFKGYMAYWIFARTSATKGIVDMWVNDYMWNPARYHRSYNNNEQQQHYGLDSSPCYEYFQYNAGGFDLTVIASPANPSQAEGIGPPVLFAG